MQQRKLTITIDKDVYEGLQKVVGRRRISQFIESLVRPHVTANPPLTYATLEEGYRAMAADEEQEAEALEWIESHIQLVGPVRPRLTKPTLADLEAEYRDMLKDEEHEAEALEWAEATFGDIVEEAR